MREPDLHLGVEVAGDLLIDVAEAIILRPGDVRAAAGDGIGAARRDDGRAAGRLRVDVGAGERCQERSQRLGRCVSRLGFARRLDGRDVVISRRAADGGSIDEARCRDWAAFSFVKVPVGEDEE